MLFYALTLLLLFFSHSAVSDSLWSHGLQHDSLPCPSIPWSLLKLTSIELLMPSNHLIFCCPLLLLPSIFPNIRIFPSESVFCTRWSKYWSFSFSINPSNEYSGLISLGLTNLLSLLFKEFSRVFSNTTVQKHQFLSAQPSL